MRQSYFKNAALLTGSDVVLRLAGMGLRIWLANALGGAGMGLYQLVNNYRTYSFNIKLTDHVEVRIRLVLIIQNCLNSPQIHYRLIIIELWVYP